MPNLSRRKSTSRSIRLAPPPRWRTVMRPYTLRPLVRRLGESRLFSGSFLVISSYVTYVRYRRAGEVGLTVRMPMVALRPLDEVDLVAGGERHDGLLPVGPAPGEAAHALELALVGRRADGGHLHVEHRLDGGADLDLVGVGAHAEGHGVALLLLAHRLLGHDRPDEHFARIPHAPSASSSAVSAARSNTTWRARRSW